MIDDSHSELSGWNGAQSNIILLPEHFFKNNRSIIAIQREYCQELCVDVVP